MSNPLLNDRSMARAVDRGVEQGSWAPPSGAPLANDQVGWNPTIMPPPGDTRTMSGGPVTDGPVTPWHRETMTVGGVASAGMVLFALLLISAAFGWAAVKTSESEVYEFPALATVGILAGLGAVLVSVFRPMWARFLGPIYALGQGFAVGAISKSFETYYDGIVVQAAGATVAVFLVMLVLYRTNIIKVTDRFRRIVVGATLGIAVFYGVSLLINLFGGNVSFLTSSSGLSIGFSILVAGLAAFNPALDFDMIERGAREGYPKQMEWFAALGLLVTIVWLYLEILRLLAKLRER
jgi:uncharacterized YccA/Bax inhibitor family protein